VAAWRACIEVERKAPWSRVLTGHGAFRRVFPAAVEHYGGVPPAELSGGDLPHPHNAFLRALVEAGVIGALALVLALVVAFVSVTGAGFRERGPEGGGVVAATLCVTLLAVVVMAVMNSNLSGNVPGQLGWLVMGMAFSWGRLGGSTPA
jgi:O-antigen ligase